MLKYLYLENVSHRRKPLHNVSDTALAATDAIRDQNSGLGYVLVCTNNNVSQLDKAVSAVNVVDCDENLVSHTPLQDWTDLVYV